MIYHPDKWALIRLHSPDGTFVYKILASWYGGYAGSDSWKLSSGVVSSKDNDGVFEFGNYSGSVYKGSLQNYGTSSYTFGIFNSWITDAPDIKIELIQEENVLELVKTNNWGLDLP